MIWWGEVVGWGGWCGVALWGGGGGPPSREAPIGKELSNSLHFGV